MAIGVEGLEKISKGVFLKPYNSDYLLIKTIPWTVTVIDADKAEDVRNAFSGNTEKCDSTLYSGLCELGYFNCDESTHVDPNYVTSLLIFSTGCNLACPHCLAGEGDYGLKHQNMTFETARKIIDYQKLHLQTLVESNKYNELDFGVFFFGGEPLLNWDNLKKVVRYTNSSAKSLNSDKVRVTPVYSVSTNGTLLTEEMADYFSKNNVDVILSIDGPTHNLHRPLKNGGDSLKAAVASYNMLQEKSVNVRINTVVLPEDVDRLSERITWFEENIFDGQKVDNTRITFSFMRGPVGESQRDINLEYDCLYSTDCIDTYIEEVGRFSSSGYQTFEVDMLRKMEVGGTPLKCSAGIERLCFVPNGNVYPCQSFIDEKFLIGNIHDYEFSHINSDAYKMFMERNVFNLDGCMDCHLQSICGVSFDCASHSYYDLGDFFRIDEGACRAAIAIQDGILKRMVDDRHEL